MARRLRDAWLMLREFVISAGPVVLIAAALLVAAYRMLDPAPPPRVVLATGVENGAYHAFGERYATLLAKHGIRVELRRTQGAAENLALLRDPGQAVDLAFVQDGVDDDSISARNGDRADGADEGLVSLGSLFHEPVWLFYREDSARRLLESAPRRRHAAAAPRGGLGQPAEPDLPRGPRLASLAQLAGWRVNVGAPGSGTPNLVRRLLEVNRVDAASMTLLREAPTPAVMALLEGASDALVFSAAPESLMVQMLLRTPGIRLADFGQAEAYSRRLAFVQPVVLPRGVVDLALDHPPADVHLVAPTASLVARETLHPALAQLFVQAARTVHGEPGWFHRKGDFPSAASTAFPLAREAERFYRSGPPFLQRHLPFWLANLVDRMWIALLSIVAILIPLTRIVPPVYEFRVRSRIFRWYGELRAIEAGIGGRAAADLAHDLDAIERRVEAIAVPLSYTDELYALRSHIQLVRARLAEAKAPGP